MKKIYIIISILLVSFWLESCTEQETPLYKGDSYIYFTNEYNQDSVSLSFFFHPGENQILVKLPLTLGGERLTENTPIKVYAEKDLTTAAPEDYVLPEDAFFRANQETDTLNILINKSTKLDNASFRLVVGIEGTDKYTAGPKDQRLNKIIFTAQKIQPDWWDNNIKNVYLGVYSHKKYELFMEVTKVSDLSDKSRDEKRALALEFKYYLQEQANSPSGPIMDGDKPMSVPVIG